MNYINIDRSILDSPEVKGSSPIQRATWLMLLNYCAGQENGGVIPLCKDWGDRKWQQLVAVTKTEIEQESMLWKWEKESLRVFFYPVDTETLVKLKRTSGSRGGHATAAAKRQAILASSDSPLTTECETRFLLFCRQYPVHRLGDSMLLEREWAKLGERSQVAALTDLPLRKHSKQWEDEQGQYVPSALRYVRERIFEHPILSGAPAQAQHSDPDKDDRFIPS